MALNPPASGDRCSGRGRSFSEDVTVAKKKAAKKAAPKKAAKTAKKAAKKKK